MTKIGAFTPETSRMILEVIDQLQRNPTLLRRSLPKQRNPPPVTQVLFRNDSGETIPPFACLQAVGTLDQDGRNYLLADKPRDTTGAAGPFFFNKFREVGTSEKERYGVGDVDGVMRAKATTTSFSAGQRFIPQVDSFVMTTGEGPFIGIGPDDLASDCIRVMSQSGGADEGETGVQTVDFFVDNFDRTTGDNLGELWSTPNTHVIDTARARSAVIQIGSIYLQRLAPGPFAIRLDGVFNPFDPDDLDGYVIVGETPESAASAYTVGLSASDTSNFVNIREGNQGTVLVTGSGSTPATSALITHDGANLTVSMGDATATYNTGALLGYVGLFSWLSDLDRAAYYQRIKAWSSAIPEPPNTESGHGTYADSTYTYMDKYHAGGSYDPHA